MGDHIPIRVIKKLRAKFKEAMLFDAVKTDLMISSDGLLWNVYRVRQFAGGASWMVFSGFDFGGDMGDNVFDLAIRVEARIKNCNGQWM